MIRQFSKATKIKYMKMINFSSNWGIPIEMVFFPELCLSSIKRIFLVLERCLAVKTRELLLQRPQFSVPSTLTTAVPGDLTSFPELFGHLHLCAHIYK